MIIQLGVAFSNILNIGVNKLLNTAIPAALNVGTQFVTGLVSSELNRAQRNDSEDAFKSLIRAAANAVSPTAAIGQTAVPAGGPATGTAFAPATLIPPSIQPAQRVLQTNPDFFPRVSTFQTERRPPPLFNPNDPRLQSPFVRPVGFMSEAIKLGRRLGAGVRGTAGKFDPRTPLGRRSIGVGAGVVAADAAATLGLESLFPPTVFAPGTGGFPTSGDPLRVGADMPASVVAPPATGLPAVGRYQKDATGFQVQWYFFDGNDMTPIDRGQAECVQKTCIYRLDVFKGKFIKMGSRRMNPMNVRAFFRAGRRVDAGERICRKMFSEKRKQKTGTVRRKSRSRKK